MENSEQHLLTRIVDGIERSSERAKIELKKDIVDLHRVVTDNHNTIRERITAIEAREIQRRAREQILVWVIPIVLTLVINGFVKISCAPTAPIPVGIEQPYIPSKEDNNPLPEDDGE